MYVYSSTLKYLAYAHGRLTFRPLFSVVGAYKGRRAIITVYIQIFQAHNFHGFRFPNISLKQFSLIKSFEYTVF